MTLRAYVKYSCGNAYFRWWTLYFFVVILIYISLYEAGICGLLLYVSETAQAGYNWPI